MCLLEVKNIVLQDENLNLIIYHHVMYDIFTFILIFYIHDRLFTLNNAFERLK